MWRKTTTGDVEVLLVHRPTYDDWTFPKGKADPGETDEAAALREVEEETGLTCELGPALPSTTYRDRRGRGKVVRYWVMQPIRGHAQGQNEVDALRWVLAGDAGQVLSYPRDLAVLDGFVDWHASAAASGGGQRA